jgi:hypothetical protein
MSDQEIPDFAVTAVWAFIEVLREKLSDEAIQHLLRPEAVSRVINFLAQQDKDVQQNNRADT